MNRFLKIFFQYKKKKKLPHKNNSAEKIHHQWLLGGMTEVTGTHSMTELLNRVTRVAGTHFMHI